MIKLMIINPINGLTKLLDASKFDAEQIKKIYNFYIHRGWTVKTILPF